MDGSGDEPPDPCGGNPRRNLSYLHSFPDGPPPVVRQQEYKSGETRFFFSYGNSFEELDERFFSDFFAFDSDVVNVKGVGIYRGLKPWTSLNGEQTPCRKRLYIKVGEEGKIDLRKLMEEADMPVLPHLSFADEEPEPASVSEPE